MGASLPSPNNNSSNVVQQQLGTTLKVITQVVCPQGFTCPSPSDFTMAVTGDNPTPSSFSGSLSGVAVSLGTGNYLVSETRAPNTPSGLVLFPTRITSTPSCSGSINGGQTVTCTYANVYLQNRADAGDGLLNSWKVDGIPYMGIDGALHHYKLPNADPRHKNLYIEVDYMQKHIPALGVLGTVKKAFANAPVSNPDGTTLDDQIPLNATTSISSLDNIIKPTWFGNATERADPNHVNLLAAKALAFHYALFAKQQPEGSGSSGVADTPFPGMNFLVTLGAPGWPIDPTTGEPVGSLDQQTGTFMHELGHNFGLTHGGGNDAINCKPNYLSIMNYLFQFPMFVANRPLDYSRSALPTLDKQNLNESNGIGQSTPPGLTTIYGPVGIGVREGPLFATAGSPVDWNFNGKFNDTDVKSDINAGLDNCGTPGPGGVNGVLNGRRLHTLFHYSKYSN